MDDAVHAKGMRGLAEGLAVADALSPVGTQLMVLDLLRSRPAVEISGEVSPLEPNGV